MGDKLGHAGLFGTLSLLANLALKRRYLKNKWLQRGSLSVFTFAMIEEASQHFFPNRTLDAMDAAADLVGIALATAITVLLFSPATRTAEPETADE